MVIDAGHGEGFAIGNIMKYTEGKFKEWGYSLAKNEYAASDYEGGPWQVIDNNGRQLIIKDVIADAFLQQILLRPAEYDVIATLNLNGDYISDALAAIVGGIGQVGIADFRGNDLSGSSYRSRSGASHYSSFCVVTGWREELICIYPNIISNLTGLCSTITYGNLLAVKMNGTSLNISLGLRFFVSVTNP